MKQHSERFELLDGLRGGAALYVVFHHARLVCWESYNTGYALHPNIYTTFDKLCMYFFSFFRFGAQAVTIFFLLSGLVIHYKHSHQVKEFNNEYKFDVKKYLRNRIVRIFPPLIFSILLMLGIAYLTLKIYNTPYPENLSLTTILGNLSFITIPFFSTVGDNYPLWSLRVEWWIYMIYPIFFYINKQWCRTSFIMVAGIAILLFILKFNHSYFWIDTLLFFPTWCLGALIADILSKRINYSKKLIWLVVFIPVVLFLGGAINDYALDFLFGLGVFPLFIFILNGKDNQIKKVVSRGISLFRIISPFSYTLYIIHYPIQTFLSFIYKRYHAQLLPHQFYLAFISIIISLAIAYLAHFITERKFYLVKK